MQTTLNATEIAPFLAELSLANLAYQQIYKGDLPNRQPVHTVYGGANLFTFDTAEKMAQAALKSFKTYAPHFGVLAKVLLLRGYENLPDDAAKILMLAQKLGAMPEAERRSHAAWLPYTVYQRVEEKLKTEALEDFRIDFEDGFGNRANEEEDAVAVQAAQEVAKGMRLNTLPPFIGIRIKPFNEDFRQRGMRTLDIFLTTLLTETQGKLPNNFIVMLPKVVIPEQIKTLVRLFDLFERRFDLPKNTLKMETMVEQTQAIMDAEGKNPLMSFMRASEGRCIAAHFGTYDYTASAGITAKYQTMSHAVCDFAHHMTKVALGSTGIMLSDGATNVMPVAPHRGDNLTAQQKAENAETVHNAWKIGFDHTTHSLINGFYQGWDLHPAQLPMRYAAVYAFFLDSYEEAAARLKHFVEKAARATLSGDIFDDAATGQGLLNYFLKALNCGAISEEEATITGLTIEEIRGRSFYKILQNRL